MRHWVYVDYPVPTEAEKEVLMLLFKGLTHAEIAKARGRSLKTVDKQVSTMMADTDTHTGRELIYEALQRGWLKPPCVRD